MAESTDEVAPVARAEKKGKKAVLAPGDSYTICEGVEESYRWPVVLSGLSRPEGLSVDDPDVFARMEWTTPELLLTLDGIHFEGKYDPVTVMAGVNDRIRGGIAGNYRRNVRAMLANARSQATAGANEVPVVSIPEWLPTPFGLTGAQPGTPGEIDAFNAAVKDGAALTGMAWVDVTAIPRSMPTETVEDGLHPAPVQLKAWAEAILPAARGLPGRGVMGAGKQGRESDYLSSARSFSAAAAAVVPGYSARSCW